MSPRAAWQLDHLGFDQVHDYVAGKADWLGRGLPTEGTGPHWAVAGEVVSGDVATCHPTTPLSEVADRIAASPYSYCVVVNENDVVLGRVRSKALGEGNGIAEDVMEVGPTTTRPTTALKSLVESMQKAKVKTMLVTTAQGRLVGVVNRDDAAARI